jgi:acyl transferase domain-containing protein
MEIEGMQEAVEAERLAESFITAAMGLGIGLHTITFAMAIAAGQLLALDDAADPAARERLVQDFCDAVRTARAAAQVAMDEAKDDARRALGGRPEVH